MAFSDILDVTVPAGGRSPTLGDDDIRAFKRAFAEILGQDHNNDQSGDELSDDTKVGYHEKSSYLHQASDPAALAAAIRIFGKDDADPTAETELHGIHETDGVTQYTSKGGMQTHVAGLTNKDSAQLEAFDVVIHNSSTAESLKGTTTEADPGVMGVLQTQKAADATKCTVIKSGRTRVNTTGAVSINNFLIASTTKGKAKPVAYLSDGCFARAVTADAGGTNGYVIADVFEVVRGSCPIGTILPWAKSFTGVPTLPGTWAECDGSAVSDSDSPLDGKTLPNLNGNNNFLRGNSTSGGTGGEDTHTLTISEMPAHTHNIEFGSSGVGSNEVTGENDGQTKLGEKVSLSTGGGGAHENKPPYYNVVWIMRIK